MSSIGCFKQKNGVVGREAEVMKIALLMIIAVFLISCIKEKNNYSHVVVDQGIVNNDTIKKLSKLPELKLYKSETVGNTSRTAYIIQHSQILNIGNISDNYKCKVNLENDTMNILINNNNKYFGNGILIKVFDGQFFVKDIDPNTFRGEEKFMFSKPLFEKLILNNSDYQKNDSIYGYIYYSGVVEGGIKKNMKGYFRTSVR